jgi:putative endonuclease
MSDRNQQRTSGTGTVSVYVLRSLTDGKRYVGMSKDVVRRLQEHNSGRVRSTRNRAPFEVVYQEQFHLPNEARRQEKYFKTASGRRFLDKVESNPLISSNIGRARSSTG